MKINAFSILLYALFIIGTASAASNTIIIANLTVVGAPKGATLPFRFAPNYTTIDYTATNYTTIIPVYISASTNTTYNGNVPYQWQGAGTTFAYNGVTYTMVASTYTQILSTKKNNVLGFYVYLNSSLWNSNESAELKAANASLQTAEIVIASIKNVSKTVTYNGTAAAGKTIKTATDSAGNITFTSTSVAKNPSSGCIILNSSLFKNYQICNAGTYYLPAITFGNHFGFNGISSIQVSATLSSNLLGNNKVPFNALIKVNGNTIYSISNINESVLSKTETFTYYPNEALNITLDGSGDANYSAFDPTIIAPPNVIAAVPIGLQNIQTAPDPANIPFPLGVQVSQLLLGFNALTYKSYLIGNLINTDFFFANGTIIPSWIEGNVLNEQSNALSTSSNIVAWINLGGATPTLLPASMSYMYYIYMGIAGNVFTTQNTLFQAGLTGEAPQLSCTNPANTEACIGTYGKYDTGNVVFNMGGSGFYDNFSGSTLHSIWTNNCASAGSTCTTSNGFTITAGNPSGAQLYTSSFTQNAGIVSFFGNVGSGGVGGPNCDWVGVQSKSSFQTSIASIQPSSTCFSSAGLYTADSSGSETSTTGLSFGSNAVYSVVIPSSPPSSISAQINYAGTITSTTHMPTLPQSLGITMQSFGVSSITLYWIRSVISPPSGAYTQTYPQSAFGTIQTKFPQVSSPTPSNTVVDVGQVETWKATISGDSGTYNTIIDIVNSHITSQILNTNSVFGSSSTTISYTYTVGTNSLTTNAFAGNIVANAIVSDSGGLNYNSTYSINANVYNTLYSTAFYASNSILDPTQYEVFTANIIGGASPYTYNFLVYNSIGTLVGNYLITTTSNSVSYSWPDPTTLNFGADRGNVIINDSASYNAQVTNSIGFTAENTLSAGILSITNPTIVAGQSTTLTEGTPSGGKSPYSTANFFATSSCTGSPIGTGSSLTVSPPATTTYSYNVIDSASTPLSACSTSNTVTVNNIVLISSTGNTGNQYETSTQTFIYNAIVGNTLATVNVLLQVNGANALWNNQTNTNNYQIYAFNYPIPLQATNAIPYVFNAVFYTTTPLTNLGTENTIDQKELWNYFPSANVFTPYGNSIITTANSLIGDNEVVNSIIKDLNNYGLATVNGYFQVGNQIITETILGQYQYQGLINSFVPSKYALINPTGTSPQTITVNNIVNLAFAGANVYRNTSITFNIYNETLGSCATYPTNAIKWTFYNGSQTTQIWTKNVILAGFFNIQNNQYQSPTISGTNAGFNSVATSNTYSTCKFPSWGNFLVNGTFTYSASPTGNGNLTSSFFYQAKQIANAIINQILYLNEQPNPLSYLISVYNPASTLPLDTLVKVNQYNPNTNTSVLVTELNTGGNNGYTNLNSGTSYIFQVYTPNGQTLLTTSSIFKAVSCSTTTCQYVIYIGNFTVPSVNQNLSDIINAPCATTALPSNTEAVNCNVASKSGAPYTFNLTIYKQQIIGQQTTCGKQIITGSGSLSCTASNTNNTFYNWILKVYLYNSGGGGQWFELQQGSFGKQTNGYGSTGQYIALILIAGLCLLSVSAKNMAPILILIAVGAGTLISGATGLIYLSTPVEGSMILLIALAGYLVLRKGSGE